MSLLVGPRRALLRGGKRYTDKVLGSNPIAYWPLNEKSGTVARCLVNPLQNGTYARDVSVMTTGAGIGDGNTAPFFDGANDVVNMSNATFLAAFNACRDLHTIMMWMRVANVGVWTDGTTRRTWQFVRDASEITTMERNSTNGRLRWHSTWGAGGGNRDLDGLANTAWMHIVLSRSQVAGQAIPYYNGGPLAAIATPNLSLGGVISAFWGAANAVPAAAWHGWIQHCAVWNRALAPAEIAALYVV